MCLAREGGSVGWATISPAIGGTEPLLFPPHLFHPFKNSPTSLLAPSATTPCHTKGKLQETPPLPQEPGVPWPGVALP